MRQGYDGQGHDRHPSIVGEKRKHDDDAVGSPGTGPVDTDTDPRGQPAPNNTNNNNNNNNNTAPPPSKSPQKTAAEQEKETDPAAAVGAT